MIQKDCIEFSYLSTSKYLAFVNKKNQQYVLQNNQRSQG